MSLVGPRRSAAKGEEPLPREDRTKVAGCQSVAEILVTERNVIDMEIVRSAFKILVTGQHSATTHKKLFNLNGLDTSQ